MAGRKKRRKKKKKKIFMHRKKEEKRKRKEKKKEKEEKKEEEKYQHKRSRCQKTPGCSRRKRLLGQCKCRWRYFRCRSYSLHSRSN